MITLMKLSLSPDCLLTCLVLSDQRVNIEIKHCLDNREEGEDDGGHGDGRETRHPVQTVSDTVG